MRRLRVGAEIETWQDDRLIRLLYRANSDLVAQRDASALRQYRKDSISVLEDEIYRLQLALDLKQAAPLSPAEKIQETTPSPSEMAEALKLEAENEEFTSRPADGFVPTP